MIEAAASRRTVAMIGAFHHPTMSPSLSPPKFTLKPFPILKTASLQETSHVAE
ncbi:MULTISPECIES: hypothetical protein [unclassified Mesorhizobium]|uniref:hypothetical protein n=1 Tax=unclassified Mesorhizobium TaxID=325217 RepID=UPI0015E48C7F|nr:MULTISPECIES: hypothetical protein [unclassified Mesorhizobium]